MHLGPALDQYVLGPKPVRAMRLIQAKRERQGVRGGEELKESGISNPVQSFRMTKTAVRLPLVSHLKCICVRVCVTRKGTATDRQTWKRHETVGRYAKVD